jgi:two-component system LytT family response regulator
MTIRCILVDDEEHARVTLRYAMSKHPDWQLLAEFKNTTSAREFLATNTIDVLFLDIQMPKESGLELARSLAAGAHPPLIVFVTAYNAHAIDAFELHALDYLLKPFNPSRFAQTLARAREMLTRGQQHQLHYSNQPTDYARALSSYVQAEEQKRQSTSPSYLRHIIVRSVGEIESILLAQVFWIGAAGNYVELHLDRRVVLHRMPLGKLEEYLDPAVFLRVHRGVIVRIDQCAHLLTLGNGSYQLRLRCGDEISVSKNHIEAVRQTLLQQA